MRLPIDAASRLLRLLPAERAHRLSLRLLTSMPRAWLGTNGADDPILASHLFGLDFPNPVGLAAGYDKNAEAFIAALALGFGFVEIGSVTPRPQPGNPRPRLFRLGEDRAVINRMGFNNDGLDAVAARLARRQGHGIIGANLGKNKDSADAAADYVAGVRVLGPHADYLVINVSSPNTPGLRALQGREPLAALIAAVRGARKAERPPLLLKIAPDLTESDKQDIAEVALSSGLDGLIVSNTTIARPDSLRSAAKAETGGLSGRPLFAPSTALLADMYRLTRGSLPLIGVGGISSVEDAYAKIRAGASLLQIYTALVYEGVGLIGRIKSGLVVKLRADGFTSLAEAVGADHRSRS
jgi:dihydroorotate dehydrogenase